MTTVVVATVALVALSLLPILAVRSVIRGHDKAMALAVEMLRGKV